MKDAFISLLLSIIVITLFALYNNTQRTETILIKIDIETSKYNDSIAELKEELIKLRHVNKLQSETIETLNDYISYNIDNRKLDISYFNTYLLTQN